MTVRVIHITEVECDDCGQLWSFTDTKEYAIKTSREEGWSIGIRVLCPECRKASQEVSE